MKKALNEKCLEIGPESGQASEVAINSGCEYKAIELGKNLTGLMKAKFGNKENFRIINDDFENAHFDLIYSAAT